MGNFVIAFGLFITTVIFIVFSIFGIEYNGKEQSNGAVFLVTVLAVNILSIAYIFFYEIRHHKKAKGKFWPYYLPLFFVLCYVIEYTLGWVKLGTTSEVFVRDVVSVTSVGIWAGTYCYRHGKYGEIVKNIEVIMLISTIAMIFALPSMFLSSLTASIGGAGDYQTISYMAALGFGLTVCRLFFKLDYGYSFVKSKVYRFFCYPLMLIQGLLCVVGGGRGGLILLITIFILFCFYFRHSLSHLMSIVVGAIVIGSILNSLLDSNIDTGIARAMTIFEKRGEDMDTNRSRIYATAFNYFEDQPILGYGFFRQYDMVYKSEDVPYWHNIFLEFLVQGGIVLFIFGVSILINFFIRTHRLIKSEENYFTLIPIAAYPMIMHLFSGTYLSSPVFWFVVVFVLGVSGMKNKEEKFKYT